MCSFVAIGNELKKLLIILQGGRGPSGERGYPGEQGEQGNPGAPGIAGIPVSILCRSALVPTQLHKTAISPTNFCISTGPRRNHGAPRSRRPTRTKRYHR
jgi:hypothetical protein